MLCIGYFGVLVGITWVSDMYSRLGLVNFTSLHKTYIHKVHTSKVLVHKVFLYLEFALLVLSPMALYYLLK